MPLNKKIETQNCQKWQQLARKYNDINEMEHETCSQQGFPCDVCNAFFRCHADMIKRVKDLELEIYGKPKFRVNSKKID